MCSKIPDRLALKGDTEESRHGAGQGAKRAQNKPGGAMREKWWRWQSNRTGLLLFSTRNTGKNFEKRRKSGLTKGFQPANWAFHATLRNDEEQGNSSLISENVAPISGNPC
jgi:hypothetical protein